MLSFCNLPIAASKETNSDSPGLVCGKYKKPILITCGCRAEQTWLGEVQFSFYSHGRFLDFLNAKISLLVIGRLLL